MSKLNLPDVLYAGPEHRPFVVTPNQNELTGAALLLHGFPGTPAEMRPLATWLAKRGWLAYGPLLPGFGQQIGALGEVRRRDWTRAALAAGNRLRQRARPLLVAGYSMGAAITLHVAEALRADLLVLLAPFWQMGDWRARLLSLLKYVWPEVRPLARADFQDPTLQELLRRIAPTLPLDDEAVQSALREELVLPTAVLGELLQLGREGYRFAAELRIPTLIIQGRQDEIVPTEASRALVEQLGGPVSYHEIQGDHEFLRRLQKGTDSDVERLIGEFIERNMRR